MLIVENMNSIKKEIKISYNLTIQMAPFTINFLLYFHLVMSICVCYKYGIPPLYGIAKINLYGFYFTGLIKQT